MTKILCPVDFSEPSDRALHAAVRLAERLDAELHLLHAYQLPIFVDPDGSMLAGVDLRGQLSTDAKKALDARAKAQSGSVELHEHLSEGRPHQEINKHVEQLGIDLVVLGTHGRTGLPRLLLGSVAERVVRTCPVPVITIPLDSERCPEPLAGVSSIVCPVDFSPSSDQATAYAFELAKKLGAKKLELVHVFQVPMTFVSEVGPLIDVEVLAGLRTERKKDLDQLVASYADAPVEVTGTLHEGVDYATIVGALEASDHDLVVMATHGRGMVAHLLLGSVAERVVRTSPIPVCTVRVKEKE